MKARLQVSNSARRASLNFIIVIFKLGLKKYHYTNIGILDMFRSGSKSINFVFAFRDGLIIIRRWN